MLRLYIFVASLLAVSASHTKVSQKGKLSKEAREICSKMMARKKMQDKYIGQCFDLYGDDFHIVLQPLLDHEVRGVEKLTDFSETLVNPVDLEVD